MKTNYVCGFAFDKAGEKVILIEKLRPKWQYKCLNGVGGKIEHDETTHEAMTREFEEETGVKNTTWTIFSIYRAETYNVHFMKTFLEDVSLVKTTTDELIDVYDISSVYLRPLIPNLRWLIPLALDTNVMHADILDNSF